MKMLNLDSNAVYGLFKGEKATGVAHDIERGVMFKIHSEDWKAPVLMPDGSVEPAKKASTLPSGKNRVQVNKKWYPVALKNQRCSVTRPNGKRVIVYIEMWDAS